jgi:hypothetical protein
LSAVLFSGRVCAHAIPVEETKQTMISVKRMGLPLYVHTNLAVEQFRL